MFHWVCSRRSSNIFLWSLKREKDEPLDTSSQPPPSSSHLSSEERREQTLGHIRGEARGGRGQRESQGVVRQSAAGGGR